MAFAVGASLLAACTRGPDIPRPAPDAIDDDHLTELVDRSVAAVDDAPEDAEAWAKLGMVYDANSFPALAAECYRRALALRPGEAQWWYHLAIVLEREDRYDDAVAALQRAAALEASYPPIHRTLALWALARGRLEEAEAAAQRAMETSNGSPGALVALGRVHLEAGRHEDAVDTLGRAVAEWSPQWGEPTYARFLLGTALARVGRNTEAAPLLAAGTGEPPALPDPWRSQVAGLREGFLARSRRARALVDAGDPDAAIRILQDLLQRHPGHLQVSMDLARALSRADRHDEAIALLGAAAAEHPESPRPPAQIARTLLAAGRRDEALRQAAATVAAHPEAPAAHALHGTLLLREQRMDEADRAFESALRFDPANETALAGRALAALRRGDVAAADAWLARLDPLAPEVADLVQEARAARAAVR